MERLDRQRITIETVRHKPVGVITTTETYTNGRLSRLSETWTVPVNPVGPIETAHEMALAEKPFQDSALEHKAAARAIGRTIFSLQKSRLKQWHEQQAQLDILDAEMPSRNVRRAHAEMSDELEGQLYRAVPPPKK